MPRLRIDLSTHILSKDMEVILVHPGARYAFYDEVRDVQVLPVDVPFLEIEDGKEVPEAADIAPMLERARQMRKWAKRPQEDASKRQPSMELESYRLGLLKEVGASGARTRLRNSAQRLLWEIKERSVVVIPAQNITGMALIAEVCSERAPRVSVSGRNHYEGMKFLARPLVNVREVPMLSLPPAVIASARSTSVIDEIGGHDEDQILRLYYGDYQRDEQSVAGVSAKTEDFDARIVGQMIDLHIALDYFIKTREVLDPGVALYSDAAKDSPFLHANINSPNGRASLQSSGIATLAVKLLIIAAAALLPLGEVSKLIASAQIMVNNSAQQDVDAGLLNASRDTLIDFFAASGTDNGMLYLQALQDGLNRNATTPQGTAEILP